MADRPTLTDMMVAYAQDAVDHAQASSGVALDYSLDSIRGVEEILESLHAALPRGFWGKLLRKGPSRQDVYKVGKMYGGYVGEVFRKAGGGEWALDAEIVPGQDTICLRNGEQRIWPVAKVCKRILNGSEDDVWFYSRVVMAEWRRAGVHETEDSPPARDHDTPDERSPARIADPVLPAPWLRVDGDAAQQLANELARELGPGHVLAGVAAVGFARRDDGDDVIYRLHGHTSQFAIVHLTWQRESRPEAPWTTLFANGDDLVAHCQSE